MAQCKQYAAAGRATRVLLCGLIVVAGLLTPARVLGTEVRPNVLFIAVDDLNHWVGYLGRHPQARTPNLDRLAESGVRFTRSYCAAPLCNASRAALMSGMRPTSTGIYKNDNDWRGVIDPQLTLTTTFKQAGYYVAGAGKIYHNSFARPSEWDDFQGRQIKDPKPIGDGGVGGIRFGPADCRDEDLDDWHVVEYGIAQLKRQHEKPFLLTIGLRKPHMPWYVPQKYFELFPLEEVELPPVIEDDLSDIPPAGIRIAKPEGDHKRIVEAGRWKEAVQAYLATVAFTDAMIGRLLDALSASAYAENTIIVLWSDHGWHLGEKQHWRKFALWEEATRSPLIWVVPGVTEPGGVCERAVDLMTVFPTLTDCAGIPTPAHVEGKSIRKLLDDPQASWEEPAVTTFEFGNHAVRTEDWRYIRYANGDEELYNETADPYEWTNLANDRRYAQQKEALSKLLPTQNAPEIRK